MAISVTSNFDINIDKPIDSRMVATDSSARTAIQFKYAGLKVFQLDDAKTYVYGTDSVWRVDGGGLQNDQTGGIYGGSGSLPSDVGVEFGNVGENLNDKSNNLYFFSELTNGDKSIVNNYFYRSDAGSSYDTLSYVIDNKLDPIGGGELQSGYIDFNSQGSGDYSETGVLSLGTGDSTNQTTKEPRLIISPRNYIEFKNSKGGAPLVIGNENSSESYIGVNYNPNTDNVNANGYQAYIETEHSGRFKMTPNTLSYQTRLANDVVWNDVLVVDNGQNLQEVTSNLKIRIDSSAKDWDPIVARNSQLLTINEFVRNVEHRFTKTLYFNQGSNTGRISEGDLILPSDGNSFEFTFNNGRQFVKNIKISRPNLTTSDFPNGSIIYIKFLKLNTSLNPYILIANAAENNGSSIYSKMTDETFESITALDPPNNQRLTILHNPPSKNGDLITFRKHNDRWEIVNIERQTRIISRTWNDTGARNSSTEPWAFTNLSFLTSLATPYRFNSYNQNVIVENITTLSSVDANRIPNSFIYTTSNTSNSRLSLYPNDFQLKISNDGNRLVVVQGNFRVNFSSNSVNPVAATPNFWFNTSNRPNIWRIGKINSVNLLPQWESTWSNCSGYFSDKGSGDIFTLSEMIFSISRNGDIFLSFRVIPPTGYSPKSFVPELDVFVPPFTYTSATFSPPVISSGAGPSQPPPP
jgi:hypothetical protein